MTSALFYILMTVSFIVYLRFMGSIIAGLRKPESEIQPGAVFPFVNVLVIFRNEEERIKANIESLLRQDYPAEMYKILYIDDDSDDNSVKILSGYLHDKRINLIRVSRPENQISFKKHAISEAVKISGAELILITDADSVPSDKWISSMADSFGENTGFTAGPVKFESGDTLFQKVQQLEFAGLISAAAGLIRSNRPVTCSGANIAFRKQAFFDAGGYEGNIFLASGDDEFLMQKIAAETRYNVKFNSSPDSRVFTRTNPTLSDFVSQRQRWASKGFFYKDKMLVAELVFIFVFFISLPAAIFGGIFYDPILLFLGISAFLIKSALDFYALKLSEPFTGVIPVLNVFLAASLFHIPYIIYSALSGTTGGFSWKGRKRSR